MYTIRTSGKSYLGDIDDNGRVTDKDGYWHKGYSVDGDYVYDGGKKVGYFDSYDRYVSFDSGKSDYYRW